MRPPSRQSDVSIAMGGGADLAQLRADAVLLSDSLADFARPPLSIARRARNVIRQNLAWALGYNALVIPLAFAGR
jgi:Cu2+-exporting ATPase